MSRPFGDDEVGVAFGAVHTKYAAKFLYQYQMFDHVFRYFYNVGSAGIGNATGVYGNNMAIRASLIRDIGGYSALDYSVTEDNALLSLVREKSDYRIAALSLHEVKVEAQPQDSWRALTGQELRWSTGAFFSPDLMTRFGYSLVKLYLAGGFIALFFAPFFPLSLIVTASTIISMASIAVTGGIMLRMPVQYWICFLFNIIWSMVYYLFVDLLAFLKVPINWKGNRLKKM
jgi:cellulose synthase/poly-beta-1,6-N-acetylglucosamine synthase-like glycosyltransferase